MLQFLRKKIIFHAVSNKIWFFFATMFYTWFIFN